MSKFNPGDCVIVGYDGKWITLWDTHNQNKRIDTVRCPFTALVLGVKIYDKISPDVTTWLTLLINGYSLCCIASVHCRVVLR